MIWNTQQIQAILSKQGKFKRFFSGKYYKQLVGQEIRDAGGGGPVEDGAEGEGDAGARRYQEIHLQVLYPDQKARF